MNATAEKLGEVLASQGTHTIGALVFWTLHGVQIPYATLAAKLDEIGLGSAMVRPPKPEAALADAVRKVQVGRKGILFRQMKREWALMVEQAGGDRLKLEHVATFRISHESGEPSLVLVQELEPYEGLSALRSAVTEATITSMRYVDTSDLSAVLCTALMGQGSDTMLGGLSLRQSTGGLYYVSAAKLDQLRRLVEALKELAPACSVEVLTLTGDAENLDAAARNVRGNLLTQLKQTREEIQEFIAKLKEQDKSVQSNSYALRAEQFRQLQARADLFADVLGDSLAELKGQIATAGEQLLRELHLA